MEQQYTTTQAYNMISEASDLLTGLYDYNSIRVEEIANKLAEAQEQVLKAEHQIRELQTQLNLQKVINVEQAKIIDDARHYTQDLQYKSGHSGVYWSLCSILKIKESKN